MKFIIPLALLGLMGAGYGAYHYAAPSTQTLSAADAASLSYIRQEEKLAHDVYAALYDQWHLPAFQNIAASEQTHTDAVKSLLANAGVADPITDTAPGVFADPAMTQLYTDLVSKGPVSEIAALSVGAEIEEIDIADLTTRIASLESTAAKNVLSNLLAGSSNHLRAFTSQLSSRGVTYEPTHLTDADYAAALAAPGPGSGRGGGRMR